MNTIPLNTQTKRIDFKENFNIIFLLILFLLASCSEPAILNIEENPRFVHDSNDPIPRDRNKHYPINYEKIIDKNYKACMDSGRLFVQMDLMLKYEKKNGKLEEDEQFYQKIRVEKTHGFTASQSTRCGDITKTEDITFLEVFHRERNWDLISFSTCGENLMTVQVTGTVGIVNLDDLPERYVKKELKYIERQNAFHLGQRNNFTGEFYNGLGFRLSQEEIEEFNEIEEEVEEEAAIHYTILYEYDGCNGRGSRTTSCGSNHVHCLRINVQDSEKKFGNVFSRMD